MLSRATWPVERAPEAVEALARAARLVSAGTRTDAAEERAPERREDLASFLVRRGAALGLELEPVESTYGRLARLLRGCAPAVLVLQVDGAPRLLAIVRAKRRMLTALGPDLAPHRLSVASVRAELARELTAPLLGEADALLLAAQVPRQRLATSRDILLGERLAQERIGGCYLMRTPAGGNVWQQTREALLGRRLFALLSLHALEYALWIASWWMIGRGALSGRLDPGWLLAWALVILTLVPLRLAMTALSGALAIDAGALLKRRLLRGALSVDTDEMRQDGVGRLLGRVIESEQVESLAISGGLVALVTAVELLISLVVLAWGAASPWLAVSLLLWLGLTAWLADRLRRKRRTWTQARLDLTHDLVEKMSGHRTRLAQEHPDSRHAGEDPMLERYLFQERRMDRAERALVAIVPRGFLILGLLGLASTVIPGPVAAAALAVTLGAILLAYRALRNLVLGLSDLMGAALAWQQVAPLFFAAREPALPALPTEPGEPASGARPEPVITAQDLRFRYRDRGDPVLDGLSLVIEPGDRLLLEGPSGSGKSTLCAMLNGMREPESGLLLLHGLDLRSMGESAWRRLVVAAPQFHENHVLANTLAFNLLMGRGWPPSDADCAEAETVCRELGLGPLLERMPSGLQQMVGETGWQLSHGEKSRVYIARALLQRARLVMLDESFAALDPRTLREVLACVLRRASTLLVIAHP